ncbi:MAG: sensor histidine kinase [Erythrobacter sp.]|nr:sensor histidine kinase [Erythrobacter sp.]
MFFDDRLATVLRQEGSSDAAKRTQFRQLLDILGNRKFGPTGRSDSSLIAAAWLRMDALGRSLPAKERAAIIREPSWRFRSADLAAHLADFEPDVASAALSRAELSDEDWCALIPRLPLRARGFLRLRRDMPPGAEALLERLGVRDRGLPLPEGSAAEVAIIEEPVASSEPLDLEADAEIGDEASGERETPAAPSPPDPIETGRSEISALVERIARFKRTREAADPEDLTDSERSPRLPLGEVEAATPKRVSAFGFSSDAFGRIDWADAEVAPMVIGKRLVGSSSLEGTRNVAKLERTVAQRQPIIDNWTELSGAPSIEGEWSVDAAPRFTLEGHFSGYVGRFRRLAEEPTDEDSAVTQEADRIRQLLHELRTPVTAVQGYAEVIQQQLFGPAPHEYRALAAAIAADAARILAGFEELDRLSRLEIGALNIEPGECDFTALARQTESQLAPVLGPRLAKFEIIAEESEEDQSALIIALDAEEAELIIWRVMATLGGACGASEALTATLDKQGHYARLVCDLPNQLLAVEDTFAADVKPEETTINAGVFGAGFSLRLARAEARASGGDLLRIGDRLALTLPLLEQAEDEVSLTRA